MNPVVFKSLKGVVLTGAWVFALGTLMQVLGYFVLSWLEPVGNRYCQLWVSTIGGHVYEPIGLTYRGMAGQALAGGQAAYIIAALVLSLMRYATLRRIGHICLIAWAIVWLSNAVWFVLLGSMNFTGTDAGLIAALCMCTVLRAVLTWTRNGHGMDDHHFG
jgi:hypothetical protein